MLLKESNLLFSTLYECQVQFRAASNVCDKLTECELRLVNLMEEVDARKSELGNVSVAEVHVQIDSI